ncbi:MAG: hypothetical protein DSM106950_15465 [Stigonema ocellatum SAG 48.90 = DSM 106950]|nr:hypothetical protein [Stigonema ocellatum SAG 48.90 = DSM 106950]
MSSEHMQKNQGIHFLGRVLDQDKQAPISGAKILLNFPGAPPFVYTDFEGIYRFTVKFDGSDSFDGQLTIESKKYITYKAIIKLLPDNRDLGDIRLITPGSQARMLTSTEIEPQPKPKIEPEIKPEIEIETQPKPKIEPETKPEIEIETQPKPEKKPQPKTQIEPQSKTQIEPQTQTEIESSMLLPIIVAVMAGLVIMIAAVTKPLPPEKPDEIPIKIRTYHLKPHKSFKSSMFVVAL